MRVFEYCLLPESEYTGTFVKREGHLIYKNGTVADLVIDTGMLLVSDYDKLIPPLAIFNKILCQGGFSRLGEWEPFELSEDEYDEMVKYLISINMPRPYRIESITFT